MQAIVVILKSLGLEGQMQALLHPKEKSKTQLNVGIIYSVLCSTQDADADHL